jgi:hypothetical protein
MKVSQKRDGIKIWALRKVCVGREAGKLDWLTEALFR